MAPVEVNRVVAACRRQPLDRTPIWLMRQAGRFLPEYRALRERWSLLELCGSAELAAEVTLQPVRRFGLDAAIIFADIMLPLLPMGVDLDFVEGEGPVIGSPLASAADVGRLRDIDIETVLAPTLAAIRSVRARADPAVAVIGFAGAPFTLASYLIEGGASRRFVRTKQFAWHEPAAYRALMDRLAAVSAAFLEAQVRAGADVVQLFDSWAGWLGPEDYADLAAPWSARVLAAVRETGAPAIHFAVGAAGILEPMRAAGGDVMGLDWRFRLTDGWSRVGFDRAVQGNLDPAVLLAPPAEIARRARAILADAAGRPGHIFNLGHGVHPETPLAAVHTLVDAVRAWDARNPG
jgi:uroporphyrinogen decarboxylase